MDNLDPNAGNQDPNAGAAASGSGAGAPGSGGTGSATAGLSTGWKTGVNVDLRNSPLLQKFEDTPEGLKKAVGGDVIEIEVAECNTDVLDLIKGIPGVALIDGMCTGNKARIKVPDANAALPNVLSTFWKNKIDVLNVAVKKPSLDQAFLEYTGRELRDEEQGSAAKNSNGTPRAKRFGRRR